MKPLMLVSIYTINISFSEPKIKWNFEDIAVRDHFSNFSIKIYVVSTHYTRASTNFQILEV